MSSSPTGGKHRRPHQPHHLDWSRDHFGGRDAELELLRQAVNVHRGGRQRCRIFFLQGDSGTGKSALVKRAFLRGKDDGDDDGGSAFPIPVVVARAKFDDSHATTPLQAWVDATESILSGLERDNDFRIHMYKSFQLSSEQSADYLSILTSVLGDRLRQSFENRPKNYRGMVTPKKSQQSFMSMAMAGSDCQSVRSERSWSSHNTAMTTTTVLASGGGGSTPADKDYSFERLKVAYRELYRVICQYITVVLFMDDIQWGEPDDFKIMATLLDDPELEDRLIFVGAHRPVGMLHGLQLLKKPGQRFIRTLSLAPLAAFEITQTLQKLFGRDDEDPDLLDFTSVLDLKTGGNPFFLRQFLQALEDAGLLRYSSTQKQWKWDIARIRKDTSISDNVLEIVSQKIRQEPHLGKILSIAAFLGSSRMDVTVLTWIMEDQMDEIKSEEQLQTILQKAAAIGLIHRTGKREYRFAHDRIRESALTLLPSGHKLAKVHIRVGLRLRSLWEKTLKPSKAERLLFQVVTQLNAGTELIKTTKEKLRLAQMNYQAAEAAIHRSAFYPAVHFLRRSKDLLSQVDQSVDQFDSFALKTETALARMEYCCGLLDKSITRTNAIINIADDDNVKAEAMHLKAICLTQQKKPLECLEVAMEALSIFGVQYPRTFVKLHVLRLHAKAKKLLKNLSDSDILNLPLMKEEQYQLASECLTWIEDMALIYGYEDHLACCMLTSVELSIEKGRNSMTAQALAAWGALLSEEGEIAEAYRFGRLSMKLSERRIGGTVDDRVPTLYYSRHHYLRHPYADGVEPFSKALKTLWARGALEPFVMDTSGYLRLCYLGGVKLQALLKDMQQFRNLCNDFGMPMARSLLDPFAQMVHNLANGPSEDMLRGEFMVETKSIKYWQQTNSQAGIQLYYFHKMVVTYFFNSYKLAAEFATKVTSMYLEGAENLVPYRFFFRALAAWTGYGITKQTKYRKVAKTMTAQVKKFVDAGVINCNHSLLFLYAERAAALCNRGRNREAVQKAYDEAISSAAKQGFPYDRALANERAGEYFIKIDDKSTASTYLKQAQECYQYWEANAKAAQMFRQYSGLLKGGGINQARILQAADPSLDPNAILSSIGTAKLKTLDSVEFVESSSDNDEPLSATEQ